MSNIIPVVEIFGPTLQGEGPNAGARCIFVRVKGCDFKCDFCDSKFTWNDHSSTYQEYDPTILGQHLNGLCKKFNCNRIVLTGGNPCIYDFSAVLSELSPNVVIDVETQGSLFPEWLEDWHIDLVVISPKPPSSHMPDMYDRICTYITTHSGMNLAIKVPVFNKDDIEFARKYAGFVNAYTNKYDKNVVKMYLSVGNSDVDTAEAIRDRVLADYEKLLNDINQSPEDFENVFILPQIHTLVWGNKQGV